ncbi:hypothetical protein CVT26_006575 [Gymnopilus dilepis]|uniref:Cation/H+ exchanger transmembrane domain-containing protein n=1 Tax=Gymnopilus dilepis TaxID=231916 RepID=A0A409Y311_9AGAR|nr:hypothetical protein CVT26_006575 [Gymnopilus dilepis]
MNAEMEAGKVYIRQNGKRVFEVSAPHIIYALLGAFIVLFGMFSLFLRERLYVGEAIWAFIFGVIIGPYCAGIFDPRSWASSQQSSDNQITLEFTRIVLAIGVFAIGVELPKAYMKKHWKSLFFLLVPVMAWGWFISAALIFALIPGLNFLSSLAVAACLTPTDPILAAAVVGGKWADKHVPAHIRHLLAAESGCNDGAAFPFLYMALYLTIDDTTGRAIKDWFLSLWLYQVILGAVIGSLLGYGFRHLMKFCQRHDLIDRNSYVAQYVSLTMLTIGVTTLLGSDDLLSAFFCGTAFAWDGFFNKQTEESVFSSVIDTLFNVAAFIYVGAWMPFNKFQDAELTLSVWRLIVIAILVLLLRRLPIMVALYKFIPDIKTFREALFTGHFGPIGIGAVFISTLALEVLENAHSNADSDASVHRAPNAQTLLLEQTIQPIVAFMVLCSITIHGLSIPSFSLGRRVHSVSRTWSRRDTVGSTRNRLPEWANQARMVTRAEDVIVNRDPGAEAVDLERGDLVLEKEKQELDEKEREKEERNGSSSGGTTAAGSLDEDEGEDEESRTEEGMEEMEASGLSGDTRVGGYAPSAGAPHTRFIEGDVAATAPAETPLSTSEQAHLWRHPHPHPHPPSQEQPESPLRPQPRPQQAPQPHEAEEMAAEAEEQQSAEKGKEKEKKHGWIQYHLWPHKPLSIPQADSQVPPDGSEQVREWLEGHERVIERRVGPGDEVEVTVIHEPDPSVRTKWRGKAHELHQNAEEVGHVISRELERLRSLARDAMNPSPSRREQSSDNGESKKGSRAPLRLFRSSSSSDSGKDVKGKERQNETRSRDVKQDDQQISVLLSRAKQAELEERRRQQERQDQEDFDNRRQRDHEDTAVDDDEDEEAWASDPDFDDSVALGGGASVPVKLSRTGSKSSKHSHPQRSGHASNPQRRRRGISSRRGSIDPEQIRGRPGAEELGAPVSSSAAPAAGTTSSSILSASSSPAPQSPQLSQQMPPRPHQPVQRYPSGPVRPHTSSGVSGSSRSSSAVFPAPSSRPGIRSRPGTADSLRNNRVDSIRFAHGTGSRRGTPGHTRESSPARSVRFVDEPRTPDSLGGRGEIGQVTALADSPVEERETGLGRDIKG